MFITFETFGGTGIDPELVDNAVILTGIGMGTAFALLVGLMVFVYLLNWSMDIVSSRYGDRGISGAERKARGKALAASVAVSTLMAQSGPAADEDTGGR